MTASVVAPMDGASHRRRVRVSQPVARVSGSDERRQRVTQRAAPGRMALVPASTVYRAQTIGSGHHTQPRTSSDALNPLPGAGAVRPLLRHSLHRVFVNARGGRGDSGGGDSGGGGGGAGKNVFWGDNVVRLSDRAPLAARAKQLVDALTGKLRFSLWLMPAAGSKFERGATLTIQTVCCFSRPRTVNMLSESGRYNAGVATSPTAQLDPRLSPWCRILQPTDIESFPAAAPAAHRAPCSWQPLLRFRRSRRTSRLGRRSSHHSATRWQSAMPQPTGSRGTLSAAPPVTSVGPWTTRSGPWQSR